MVLFPTPVGMMVAGAMKLDLLTDLKAAVAKGVTQGTTLAEFRKDFDAIVQKHGWTGWTGEGSEVGRTWRTRLIYETNLRTAWQAGRWAQTQEGKAQRPFLIYRHSDLSLHPRPLHQSWNGLVVAVDDPWVQTHWPPNGWGCKCRMFALGPRDLAKLGKSGPDTPPDDGTYVWKDKVTGLRHEIPRGIDPGWDYAPGASRVGFLRQEWERKAERMGIKPDVTPPKPPPALGMPKLHQVLSRIESEIVGGEVESTVVLDQEGTVLLRKTGDANSVGFTEQDLALLADATVTHNHPVVTSFSPEDVRMLVNHGLRELRAVDLKWRYILERANPNHVPTETDRADLLQRIDELEAGGWGAAWDKLLRQEITEAEFNETLYHWMWEGLNETGLLIYRREPRQP